MSKKFLSFFLVLLFATTLWGQYNTLWEKTFKAGNTPAYLGTGSDGYVRGFAFGKFDGQKRILVATRAAAVGNKIVILDAATGDSLGYLPKPEIITGGSGAVLCDVEVSEDGQIFAGNLTTGHITSPFKIYRWKSLTDTMPKVVLEYKDTVGLGSGATIRLGDKFTVVGKISDGTFRLYAASATTTSGRANNVLRFKYDAEKDTLELEKIIKLKVPAITSAGSAVVCPLGVGDTNFFWKAAGENLRYFDKDGNQLSISTSSMVPTGSNAHKFFSYDGRNYIFMFRYGSSTENGAFYDVTYGSGKTNYIHFTPSMYKNSNSNGTGDVAIEDLANGKVRVYVLSTNNGIGAYETEFYTYQNIAEVRKQTIVNDKPDKLNKVVHTKGIVTSKNLDTKGAYFIQDNTGGIYIYRSSNLNWIPEIGDEIEVYGRLTQFNGLTEIVPNCDSVIFISKKQRPIPQELTVSEINANGEQYEGKLVVIKGLRLADTAKVFPINGQTKNVKYAQYNDTIIVRIVNAKNIFTAGNLPKVIDLIGNVGQYSLSTVKTDGYQIFPSSNADFLPPLVENIPVKWQKVNATAPAYFDSANGQQSMTLAYKNGKPRLYVLSNKGGVSKIHAYDALTGNFIKEVKVPAGKVFGSVFTFEDKLLGITYSDGPGKLEVFNYDDDNLLPKKVYEFSVSGKAGNRVKAKYLGEDSLTKVVVPVENTNKFYVITKQPGESPAVLDSVIIDNELAVGIPSIVPMEDSFVKYLIKAVGKKLYALNSSGSIVDSIESNIIPLEASDIELIDINEQGYIVSYTPNYADTLPQNTLLFTDVYETGETAFNKYALPKFGNIINNQGIANIVTANFGLSKDFVYLLSPNNGIVVVGLDNLPEPPAGPKPIKFYTAWGRFGNKLPGYFSPAGNTERGATVGKLGNEWAYFVVARNGGPKIVVHNITKGDSILTLPKPAVDKGYFPLNVVGAAEEGDIFVSNMTLNAKAGSEFTVYRYLTSSTKPDSHKVVISYTSDEATARMGDAISVYGKLNDNSLKIYAGIANLNKFVVFSTTDNGNTFTPNVITISDENIKGIVPYVAPFDDSTYIFKVYGKPFVRVHKNGEILETMPTAIGTTNATTVNVFSKKGRKYIVTYLCDYFGNTNPPNEKALIFDVTDGLEDAVLVGQTPSLGTNKNGNATGNVTVVSNLNKYSETETDDFDIYLIGTNNGIARFTTNLNIAIKQYDTLKYYDVTKPALYKMSKGGWYAGPNYYGDLGKAQRLDHNPNDNIYGFRVYFGVKKIVDEADSIWYCLRKAVGNNDPKLNGPNKNNYLVKIPSTTAEIDTMGYGNVFMFDQPVVVDNDSKIFVTVEWKPTLNDTFAIICDQHRGFTDVPINYRVWEQWGDANWYAWQQGSYYTNINSDLWIETYYEKATVVGTESDRNILPENYVLYQNYPNPFNPTTSIKFALKTDAMVNLKIYNILGQEVATLVNNEMTAGMKTINFNASNLASGVYIYRLEVLGKDGSKFVNTKKMMLLK